jgi:ABC-type lipoprotein export system ATPase subunit
LRLFADEEALDRELATVRDQIGPHLGLISSNVPLISNLDVWHNIALIRQYHSNMPEKKAKSFVIQCLQRLELEGIAYKRNPFLSGEERFCAMLLRAAMVDDAVIVIDRPYNIMPHLRSTSFIYAALEKIDDLFTLCYIFDYNHDKNKYRMTDASEN